MYSVPSDIFIHFFPVIFHFIILKILHWTQIISEPSSPYYIWLKITVFWFFFCRLGSIVDGTTLILWPFLTISLLFWSWEKGLLFYHMNDCHLVHTSSLVWYFKLATQRITRVCVWCSFFWALWWQHNWYTFSLSINVFRFQSAI